MGIQSSGGGGSQAGYYYNQSTGDTSGTTGGTSSQSTTGQNTGSTSAVPTSQWSDINNLIYSMMGGGGATPGQASGINYLNSQIGAPSVNQNINYADQVLSRYVGNNNPAPTISGPGPVSTNTVLTAASPYLNYLQPIVNSEVNAGTNQLTNQAASTANNILAQYGGSGAYGGGGMATALGNEAAQAGLGVANLVPQLEMQGFNAAVAPATTDVQSGLTASTADAANALQTQLANQAANEWQQGQSINTIQDYINNTLAANSAAQSNTQNAITGGATPLTQLLSYMQGQTPGFGSTSISNMLQNMFGNTTGTYTGNTSGSSAGYNSGTSGQSSHGVKI